jgi:phage-related protein
MTGDFPRLEVGSNTITLGTGITKVEIEPRWRYL